MASLSIGRLSELSGVKVTTIRYYESIGLLGLPDRTRSNRRVYGEKDAARLRFIRHARDLGFEIEAIRDLLAFAGQPDRPCGEVDEIARGHLADIDARISQLTALRGEIARMVDGCGDGTVRVCRVIETLADHSHCASEHGRTRRTGTVSHAVP